VSLGSKSVWIVFLTVLGLAVQLGWGLSRVVDPEGQGPSRDLLMSMEAAFEDVKIDVVVGPSKALPPPEPGRPRIASLTGFQAHTLDWGAIDRDSWERAFQKGAIGVLTAFKPSAETAVTSYAEACRTHVPPLVSSGCRFVESWLNTKPDLRVFLAFTSADAWQVQKAKEALEKQGFVVFIFLDTETAERWAEPGMIGEIFAQSSHRLVLDTQNSRGSAGVSFEASCEDLLMSSPNAPWTYLDLVEDSSAGRR
jgi:hypothetical protein